MTNKYTLKNTIIQVTGEGMGQGERDLRLKLISKYFQLLAESNILPNMIFFYNEGVKLTIEDSPLLPLLHTLEEKGVRIVVCSTCLGYYHLVENLAVGIAGGMTDLIEAQAMAEKVITL